MIREFQYTFHDLEIVQEDIIELLGFNQTNVPEPFPEMIDKALKEAAEICEIKFGFNYFNHFEIDPVKQEITVDHLIFSPGKNVIAELKNASSIALFVGTAGENISLHSMRLAENGDQLLSYIFDIIGSLAADITQEKVNHELEKEVSKSGLKTSNSYSPGHRDWNISDQLKLFSLLPDNFCGVTLSESLLMNPYKIS